MYPKEIKYSEIASDDVKLCIKLLREGRRCTGCELGYLSKFDSPVLNNTIVLEEVIVRLEKELRDNPKYRFEYQENCLLRRIINREVKRLIKCINRK